MNELYIPLSAILLLEFFAETLAHDENCSLLNN